MNQVEHDFMIDGIEAEVCPYCGCKGHSKAKWGTYLAYLGFLFLLTAAIEFAIMSADQAPGSIEIISQRGRIEASR